MIGSSIGGMRAWSVWLVLAAAAMLYAQATAHARQKHQGVRPPTTKPPVVLPPRTGIDGARGYKSPEELRRAPWATLYGELVDNPVVQDKKTGKWGFKGTNETFHSQSIAADARGVMVDAAGNLKDGNVDGAKERWKFYNWKSGRFWHGRSIPSGQKNRDVHYGSDKAGKAAAKADETAHQNIMDQMWKGLKSAEAKGMKPGKPSSPVTN